MFVKVMSSTTPEDFGLFLKQGKKFLNVPIKKGHHDRNFLVTLLLPTVALREVRLGG